MFWFVVCFVGFFFKASTGQQMIIENLHSKKRG